MEHKQYLTDPKISTHFQLSASTGRAHRLFMAQCFLSGLEFDMPVTSNISLFENVEEILKAKVLTYAIAFAKGATNGGLLFQNARADLLTWRAIYDGATFVNGWLQ